MKKHLKPFILLLLLSLSLGTSLSAQRGIGFRFASDFNYFFKSENYDLIDGSFSTIVIGPFYQAYFKDGGFQAGLNFIHKGTGDGFFSSLPVVQKDFNGPHTVGMTALEFDLKCGPRFGPINPKLGYLMGYRFKQEGFLEDGKTAELNRLYIAVPFGLTADFPTGYGSVGAGIFYDIGLTNVLHKPAATTGDFNGSRLRSFNVELFVVFATGEQKRKIKPDFPPPPED